MCDGYENGDIFTLFVGTKNSIKIMDIFSAINLGTKIGTGLILVIVGIRLLKHQTIRQQRFAVLAIFGVQIASLILYYSAWWHRLAGNPATKNLLWPKSDYLVRHVMTDMTSLITGWGVGVLLLLFCGWFFLRRGGGKLLDGKDIGLLFFASVAVGWPSFLIVLGMVFILAVLWMILLVLLRKKTIHDRLVISPVIIPAAILTLIFQEQLLTLTHLAKIGF